MAAARFLVEGRVQGVGFRAWTRRRALELGLRGHARNLPDGRVEVLADGAPAALEQLADALRVGPPLAKVAAVARMAAEAFAGEGFHTG